MSVWCNRWYNEGFTALVLITGWEFFCIKIQKGTGHVSIRDVVKLKNTTSPNTTRLVGSEMCIRDRHGT